MIKKYLRSNLRYFKRHFLFAGINILGLSIGFSAAIVIYLIVNYHYSFDRFEPDHATTYRIVSEITLPETKYINWGVPLPLPMSVKNNISGIKDVIPIVDYGYKNKVAVTRDNNTTVFREQKDIVFTDRSYFKRIPSDWMAGDKLHALDEPFKVVITTEKAKLYFPGLSPENVLGKVIVLNDSLRFSVTGVVRDQIHLTDFGGKAFLSFSTIPFSGLRKYYDFDNWKQINSQVQCLIVLSKDVPPSSVERQLSYLERSHISTAGDTTEHKLQALSDVHFNEELGGRVHKSSLQGLLLMALFLLLIGCINFVNLSTIEASQRTTEVGIRKTLGGSQRAITIQFLSGTFLLSSFAAIVALVVTPIWLSIFSEFIPADLSLHTIGIPGVAFFTLFMIIVVGAFSGVYPAVLLARLSPVRVLKGNGNILAGKARLRKVLTVFQFVMAQVLVIGTLAVAKQINYSLHRDMGFRKAAIVDIKLPNDVQNAQNKRTVLVNTLRALPQIEILSMGSMAPTAEGSIAESFRYLDGKTPTETFAEVRTGDSNYLSVFALKLIAGKNVQSSDSPTSVLINESYSKLLGFQEPTQALNRFLILENGRKVPIIGVLSDFTTSLEKNGIHPVVFYSNGRASDYIHILLHGDDPSGSVWRSTLAEIENNFRQIYPEDDINVHFFDREIDGLYQQDNSLFKLLTWAAGIAIFIGCLGMFGLAAFLSKRRAKEIALRKVLGSSVMQIVYLISADFVRLVLLGFVISIPIAWWTAHKWLENYAYQTTLDWWIYLMGGTLMAIIAVFILTATTLQSARANPAKNLRVP